MDDQGYRFHAWVNDSKYAYLGKNFDLFGMSELECAKKDGTILDDGSYIPREVFCPVKNAYVYPYDCLLDALNELALNKENPPTSYAGSYFREIGLMRNVSRINFTGQDYIQRTLPCGTIFGLAVERYIVGGRFQIASTNINFHLYSTHLSTYEAYNAREAQTDKIVEIAKQYYRKGDFPPIVLGDFNDDDKTGHKVRDKMGEYFIDVGASLVLNDIGRANHYSIDHVWIGRPSGLTCMFGSGGTRRPSLLSTCRVPPHLMRSSSTSQRKTP